MYYNILLGSSSPSGLHYGHHKAAILDEELSEIEALAISIPFRHGFSYERWQKSIHCMLRKEEKPYIHRLRIIQLFEADFNIGLKIIYSRRMMKQGEKFLFSGEQAQGGRQGRTAHDHLSNLQYTAINAAVTRTPIVFCFNNQKGNFDRIRLNVNSIGSRRMGTPKNATLAHASTLCNMKHQIRTIFGDSSDCIQPHPEIAGIGQGSGNGTPGNHVQSIPMMDVLQQKTRGCTITDPTGQITTTQHAVGWIDDVTNKISFPATTAFQIIIFHTIKLCQIWRRIIQITGGDMAIIKCCVFLITWKFQYYNCKPYMTTTNDTPGEISFPDDDTNKSITIKRKNPKQTEKNLGFRFNPSARMTAEHKYRLQESQDMAVLVHRGFFSRKEMTLLYHSRWQSVISYYLPVTTFSHNQCQRLQAPMYAAMLPKMAYNRHIKGAVRHGPKKFGGSGFIDMYTEQGLKHLQHFLGNLRQHHHLSDIIRSMLSNYQLMLGLDTFFLNTPLENIPFHIPGRLTFLWSFSNQYDITYDYPEVWLPTSDVPNDINITSYFSQIKNFSPHYFTIINACRIYLEINFLSELVTSDGLELRQDILFPPIYFRPTSSLQ